MLILYLLIIEVRTLFSFLWKQFIIRKINSFEVLNIVLIELIVFDYKYIITYYI